MSTVNIDEPMFQPYPSEIFFQKFKPFETYEIPFQLRNNDKVNWDRGIGGREGGISGRRSGARE